MVSPEQLRPMLFLALAFVLYLMYQQWQEDYGPKPVAPVTETATQTSQSSGEMPSVTTATSTSTASAEATTGEIPAVPAQASDVNVTPASAAPVPDPKSIITVTTDLIRVSIDTAGGTLRGLELLKYPLSTEQKDLSFKLLNDSVPDIFMAQSGLLGDNAPNHWAVMQSERTSYTLAEGEDSLEVVLTWTDGKGITVRKVYEFARDKYVFDLRYEIHNASAAAWSAQMYGQFLRTQVVQEGGIGFIYTYTGGILNSEEQPYEKIEFSDMADANLERNIKGGWVAMIQHYFGGAWIPSADDTNHYYSKALADARYLLGIVTPVKTIPPGASDILAMRAYIGPKIQGRMLEAAPGLERTVDFGWLWLIAHPLFLGLSLIQSVLGNWGWSIIVLTLLIKLAFFHLSATSYKSMARMRKLQPRMVQLRERHGDDRQKMNQAMMELYKTEKINPLGGCLPILVQIPVFISLYWMLLESVELRHAPFMFWLTDLASHDPYFVLPVLMGVSMLIQQRLNPTPPDPMQAKVMMALPFVFTFFFLWFPSGLVLYWVVNNVLSIAQQWVITRRIERGG
jgi:YidC/Oxa1 family membrane protein insertase